MTRKQKILVFSCSLAFTLLLALAGAIPYGYFLLALGGAGGGDFIVTLCWALYIFVAVLLWLTVWRLAALAVTHRPGRRG